MKGHLTSFVGLFGPHAGDGPSIAKVEIPLIQRDYAQGRTDPATQEIRTTFLEVLVGAVAGGDPASLDFVYGRIDGHGMFHPLDGQQRLTTLFLLHWYVAAAAGHALGDATWTNFSYATRASARRFCEQLVGASWPLDGHPPRAWIVDQPWYLSPWRTDPTIQAMLVMLDAIHDAFAGQLDPAFDFRAGWARLIDVGSPAISFYVLPLEDMESDEALYITMNSRGKPLTPFESFKATFEQDIRQASRAGEFAHKIDGAWSDLLWPFRGDDDIVDDELMRYIEFVTEICELREGRITSGRLGPRARAVYGPDNERSDEHLGFLIDAFDVWTSEEQIASTFAAVFTTDSPGDEHYDPQRCTLFGAPTTNLFEQCCQSVEGTGNRAFTLQQSLLLYAVLLHLLNATDDFPRRIRVVRNLVAASDDEIRRPNMPSLIQDVEAVVLRGDLTEIRSFSANQVADEERKAAFVSAHPPLRDTLRRLEDHSMLRGTLSAFALDVATFQHRSEAFEAAFSDPTTWIEITGALLATGDYHRRRPGSLAWQFGTSSPANEGVWRFLLTNASFDALEGTRTTLGVFLDRFSLGADVAAHCTKIRNAWLGERESSGRLEWRYYLVKYAAMRRGATGIYFGVDGALGYSLCMMRTRQLNGYYRDPILLEIWNTGEIRQHAEDPWFTGYETRPRWLRLMASGAGLRSVENGFALLAPEDKARREIFESICSSRADVECSEEGSLLRIPQVALPDGPTDSIDRVVIGAHFVQELIDAGL